MATPDHAPQRELPRVLVVDDESANLDTFRRVFRKEYQMEFAESGEQALDALKNRRFDALITDFSMPGMDGVDLIQKAKGLYPDLGCLIVTAFAEMARVRDANACGWAAIVIAKPWDRDDVLRWVQIVSQLSRTRRSSRDLVDSLQQKRNRQ